MKTGQISAESKAVLEWVVENGMFDALHKLLSGRRDFVAACSLVGFVNQELSDSEGDLKYARVKSWLDSVEPGEALALARSVQGDSVVHCHHCEMPVPESTAHLYEVDVWYGDCCWDERLRN